MVFTKALFLQSPELPPGGVEPVWILRLPSSRREGLTKLKIVLLGEDGRTAEREGGKQVTGYHYKLTKCIY